MDIISRLKMFIEHTALPVTQFADTALIPRPTLSQILNGRNKKISNELFSKLHEAFPELNIMWLMFGDGAMLVEGYENLKRENNAGAAPHVNDSPTLFENQENASSEDEVEFPLDFPDVAKNDSSSNFDGNRHSDVEIIPGIGREMPAISKNGDSARRVSYIMVFYDDNSFEIFHKNK